MQKLQQHPILILIVINLLIGLMTFRSYGLTWDEPLFYEYGQASLYAYTPANWFNPNFDITRSFGASASDHANRGPAYLVLAAPLHLLLTRLELDTASAWHLINFLTFNLGIYLLYRLASKWMSRESAFTAAALFALQPLLWGHAFINSKDSVFSTFFIASILSGFNLVERLPSLTGYTQKFRATIIPAIILGVSTSVRILAPLAALLTLIYALLTLKKDFFKLQNLAAFFVYGITALLAMTAAWPYLWLHPLYQFSEVLKLMGEHPASIQVLFSGELYRAYDLPRSYLPKLLALTLTEPVLPLFALGVLLTIWKREHWRALGLTLLWVGIPAAYVVLSRPPLSDNFRHFLFILPPLFIFAGISIEFILQKINLGWVRFLAIAILLLPGGFAIITLHPYPYTYYNTFASKVNEVYETDYWLTCYREAVLEFNQLAPDGAQLFVRREPQIAAYYSEDNINIRDYRSEKDDMQSGDFYLVNTRANEHLREMHNLPAVIEVSRNGNSFCLIKQVP